MHFKNFFLSFLFIFSQFLFAQAADHLVLSEILVNGKNESAAADNDEFVEIYNPTSDPVDVSNWTIDYRSSSTYNFQYKIYIPLRNYDSTA